MTTVTEITETYAATYADGEAGVDLIYQDVERDEEGTELSRTEAGWAWHGEARPVNADRDLVLGEADETLTRVGYRRTSPWQHHVDLGGHEGWTANVEV